MDLDNDELAAEKKRRGLEDMDRIGVMIEIERSLDIDKNINNTLAVLLERITRGDKIIDIMGVEVYNDNIDLMITLLEHKKIKIIDSEEG